MPRNIGYPAKTRNVAVGKPYPGRTRNLGTMADAGSGKPSAHSNPKEGKKPRKGVLSTGGGHG